MKNATYLNSDAESSMRRTNHFLPAIVVVMLTASSATADVKGQSPQPGAGDETGTLHYQKANMHLCPEGKWALGEDKWGKIVRVNMLKITAADWAQVPGVKKAWPMKGFEGVPGMAFHPIISEVKDVDGDGKPDIFRCRSEHPGARIERLRYDDGSVVWESEPVGAMHGDESRLPVFDLHGERALLRAPRQPAGLWKLWCINADTGETRVGDGQRTATAISSSAISSTRRPRRWSSATAAFCTATTTPARRPGRTTRSFAAARTTPTRWAAATSTATGWTRSSPTGRS